MCFHLFNSEMWNAWDSKIYTTTATSLPVLMPFAFTIMGFFESVKGRTFRLCCEFGTSVTRGTLGDRCTLFDRIAIPFSETASNCTHILYCDKLSKYAFSVRFWVCPDRIQLLSDLVEHPSGSRLWRTLTACPFWGFFLLGSVHFW